MTTADYALGTYADAVEARISDLATAGVPGRIWGRDHAVWFPEPRPELVERLGWLELPHDLDEHIPGLIEFGAEIGAGPFRHAVLLGMGGSSLAPEVFARTFGSGDGFPELIVLDSTHPEAIRAVVERIEPLKTLFIVASKSGTTVETRSLAAFFFDKLSGSTDAPGSHFVALTDPNSDLERLAFENRYRRTFFTPPEVGGRFSALSYFGMVPAAVIGAPLAPLAVSAQAMADACKADDATNPGLRLGAALGVLALNGRDKVTFLTSSSLAAFPAWIEQLIAESTGKEGTGIVPVTHEPTRSAGEYGDDRVFVSIALESEGHAPLLDELSAAGHPVIRLTPAAGSDIAGEMYRLEFATAVAGAVLGINPFDQPDVQAAKSLAKKVMAGEELDPADEIGATDDGLGEAIDAFVAETGPGAYIGIQAYLPTTPTTTEALQTIRAQLGDRTGVATSVGYGPRFLHSTGQLHKGGPDGGAFIQIVDRPHLDIDIPGETHGFRDLIAAQALGDYHALRQAGRRVLRIDLRGALGSLGKVLLASRG